MSFECVHRAKNHIYGINRGSVLSVLLIMHGQFFFNYLDVNMVIPVQFVTLFTLGWCRSPPILCGSLKGQFSCENTTVVCCIRKVSFQLSFITVPFQFGFYCCDVHH